jgi:hypothetical protein
MRDEVMRQSVECAFRAFTDDHLNNVDHSPSLIYGITVRLLPFDQPISWSIAPGMKILIKCDFF